jgi:hypothetical protein
MGQLWLLCNLSRGCFVPRLTGKLRELLSGEDFALRAQAALRQPGGAWSGDRVLLTGDGDDDRGGRVAAYLAARGLALLPDAAPHRDGGYLGNDPYCVGNLYRLLSDDGPLRGTADGADVLGLRRAPEPAPAAEAAVSHDARQRLALRDHVARTAFMCLLAESSELGSGDYEVPFRGDWAAHRVAVLPEAHAAALGYAPRDEQVRAALLDTYAGDNPHTLSQLGTVRGI